MDFGEGVAGGGAGMDGAGGVAELSQGALDELSDAAFVFDDEDFHGAAHGACSDFTWAARERTSESERVS